MRKQSFKLLKLLLIIFALSLVGIGVSRSYFSSRVEVGEGSFSTGTWGEE
ncbi:MAG: hypothetical protein GTN80_04515 [Nitrososphaeria archaeon]|nr:hypothetical protein [Nitrososphaeria archaeon]NIT03957.1 hypothetical protein [Candidatus Saccharibacteria bacterium]